MEQSRRDDLESLANIMIYLKVGKLPWHRLSGGKTQKDRYNLIVKKKSETALEELVTEDMPCK
jgi:hypothetical protein